MVLDSAVSSCPLRRRLRRLTPGERRDEAVAFLRRFAHESGLSPGEHRARVSDVVRSLRRTGWYEHTPAELAFGARLAWRNNPRCIGRLFWASLEVVDARHMSEPDEMASAVVSHLRRALGDGRVRSVCTVFRAVQGEDVPGWIESRQAVQYAGYLGAGARVLGDPMTVEATRTALSLGWSPPGDRTAFDVLPLIVRDRNGRRAAFPLPTDSYREVAIVHPTCAELGALGLRWYAVPLVTSMILTIGGLDYPCAPFNGFYMGTEIASRDLGDERRYNALPRVARALGLDPEREPEFVWRDRALCELNVAVLHSFREAGVTIVDHHTASAQFMDFVAKEQAAARAVSADWSWIVPPQASSACPVFHLAMRDLNAVPNYYGSRASDGADLEPFEHDLYTHARSRSTLHERWKRLKRRYRRWRRRLE